MRWYVGEIAEAVATSKARSAIFVVYIEGIDDVSRKLTSIIDSDEISKKLELDEFVALKLTAETQHHRQFKEVYKNATVPSIFFIGRAGQTLDIITDINNVMELSERIDKVIEKHKGGAQVTVSTQSRSTLNTESQTVINDNVSEASTGSANAVDCATKCKANVENISSEEIITINPRTEIATDIGLELSPEVDETESQLSLDEKILRAKELVDKKKEEKIKDESEKEKQKEIDRRKVGQEVQKLKEWQKDQELKELLEQRKKERNEDKMARERILAQIAQDRADRAARFASNAPPISPVGSTAETTRERVVPATNSARIQFRLPNGNTCSHTFDTWTTLQQVRAYIVDNMNLPFRNFGLATTFPRREFTDDDNLSSLHDLQLCPTAVIMIIPSNTQITTDNQGGGLTGLFWFLLSPIFGIFSFFRNMVFGPPPTTGRPEASTNERNKRTAPSGEHPSQQSTSKRRVTDSTTVKRQGNIARFTDNQDSDDENNTWNGNSTQQM